MKQNWYSKSVVLVVATIITIVPLLARASATDVLLEVPEIADSAFASTIRSATAGINLVQNTFNTVGNKSASILTSTHSAVATQFNHQHLSSQSASILSAVKNFFKNIFSTTTTQPVSKENISKKSSTTTTTNVVITPVALPDARRSGSVSNTAPVINNYVISGSVIDRTLNDKINALAYELSQIPRINVDAIRSNTISVIRSTDSDFTNLISINGSITNFTSANSVFGNMSFTNATGTNLTVTGNLSVSGTQSVSGALAFPYFHATDNTATSTIDGNLHVKGRLHLGENSLDITEDSINSPDGSFTIATAGEDSHLTLQTLGRVGIASSTPWGVLSVEHNGAAANLPVFVASQIGTSSPFLMVDYMGRVGIAQTTDIYGAALQVSGWNGGPSAVFTNNVGIGTSSPFTKFSVVGNGYFNGTVTANSFVGDGSGLTNLPATSFVGKTTDDLTQGSTNKYFSASLAQAALSSSATGLTYNQSNGVFSLTSGYTIPLIASTTEWSSKVGSQWTTNGSNINFTGGNVGIGVPNPSQALAVEGDGYFNGDLSTSGTITAQNLVVNGTNYSGLSAPATAQGTINYDQGNYWNQGNSFSIYVYAYKTIGSTRIYSSSYAFADVTDDGANDRNFAISWSWDAVPEAEGYRVIYNNNNYQGYYGDYYYDTTDTSFVDDACGSVCFTYGNTVTPTSGYANALVLNGSASLSGPVTISSGNLLLNSGSNISIRDASGYSMLETRGAYQNNNAQIMLGDYEGNFNGSYFSVNPTNSLAYTSNMNLAVNQSYANYSLDVNGDINLTGTLRKSGTAVGLWFTDGSNIYNTNSNIGVGVSIPSEKFEVYQNSNTYVRSKVTNPNSGSAAQAQIAAQNNSGSTFLMGIDSSNSSVAALANRGYLYSPTSAGGMSFIADGSTDIRWFTGGSAAANEKLRLTSGGNFGIGVNPTAQLHVNLPTASTNTVNSLLIQRFTRPQTASVKWGNSMDILLGSYGTSLTSQSRVDFRLANGATDLPDTTVLTMLGSGSVGIGTTSPFARLAISGSGNSTGLVFQTSNNANNVVGLSVTDNGNVGIGTSTPSKLLSVSHSSSGVAPIVLYLSNIAGTAGAGNEIRLSGSQAANWYSSIRQSVTSGGGSSMQFLTTTSGGVENNGLIIDRSGNVGIGTTSPYSMLSVAGQIVGQNFVSTSITATSTFASGVLINSDLVSLRLAGSTGANGFDFSRSLITGALHIQGNQSGNNNIILAPSSGNVGIGTPTPGFSLEVNGTIASKSANPLFGIYDTDSNTNALYLGADFGFSPTIKYGTFAINRNPTNGTFFNTGMAASQINLESASGNADITFYTTTTNNSTPSERMRILGNGNIGIGTSVAGARLDISSPSTSAGSHALRISGNASAAYGRLGFVPNSGTVSGIIERGSTGTLYFGESSDTGGFEFRGIGVTNIQGPLGMATGTVSALGLRFTSDSNTGFYSSGSDVLGLVTGGTERLTINSSGSVGIGVTSPTSALDIVGQIRANTRSTGQQDVLYFKGGPGGTGSTMSIAGDTTGLALGSNVGARLSFVDDGLYGAHIVFENRTGSQGLTTTEKMRLTTAGNLGIGTSSPTYRLEAVVSGTDVARFWGNSGSTSCIVVAGTGWSCSSDIRLKQNIHPLEDSLSKVLGLQGISYNWKQGDTTSVQIGFAAQDVEQIMPELVRTDASGYKSVLYAQFTPYIIEAIKGLNLKIDAIGTSTIPTAENSLTIFADILSGSYTWSTGKITAATGFFKDIFAKKVTTEQLCVGDKDDQVCVTKDDLKNLLQGAGAAAHESGIQSGGQTPSPNPEVSQEITPTPSPETTPEQSPESSPEVPSEPTQSPDQQ